MIISDGTLRTMLVKGEIGVTPLGEHSLQPASLDCRLGTNFLMLDYQDKEIIDLEDTVRYTAMQQDTLILPPHTFILATTLEYISLPNHITAFVEGRSSIGRLGLFIQNAGWVDPGFQGCITLELYNASPFPIRLQAGKRICQLVFCLMDQPALVPYHGKYQGQKDVMGSKIHEDREARPHASVS